jgi:small subunit ribosomal protein S10e
VLDVVCRRCQPCCAFESWDCRQWFYYFLTDEGIAYLRQYLYLDENVVPDTLKKPVGKASGVREGAERSFGGRGRGGFGGEKGAGAPGEFRPRFGGERAAGGYRREGGFGRGGAPAEGAAPAPASA